MIGNRRAFLKGLGGAALALPFLPSLHRGAAAQGARPPIRLVIFHTANGQPMRLWKPTAQGNDFALSPVLEPLAPFKRKLLVLSGLDMPAVGGPNGHETGTSTVLTGAEPTLLGAGGPSVDQIAAQRIGGQTPLRSLELGVQTVPGKLGYVSYLDRDQPVPTENDPARAWRRVFGEFRPGAPAAGGLDPRDRSVLDAVRGDYARVNARLGAADRRKLDAHLEQVRELERRFSAPIAPGAACAVPAAPADGISRFPDVGRSHLALVAAALACDATRVASVMWQEGSNNASFDWADPAVHRSHHEISHTILTNTPVLSTQEERELLAINQWYARQFAEFLGRLDAIPEGDGTLLDHTVVVWTNELSDGFVHSRTDMPFVVAGGGAAGLRTGRWMDFGHTPHNALLVSLLNAVGVRDVQRVGDFGAAGPLPGLT